MAARTAERSGPEEHACAGETVGQSTLDLAKSIALVCGSQRIGALDIHESLTCPDDAGGAGINKLQYLIESADRIEEGLPIPAALEAIFVQGSGLGGARPKATVRDNRGVLWLAKFPSKSDRMSVTEIEEAALRLAAECGIRVPPTQMMSLGSRKIMLIRRFDRYWSNAEFAKSAGDEGLYLAPGKNTSERRVPFASAPTFVGCTESESIAKSYKDIADAIRRYVYTDLVRADVRELFKRMVFNIFVSNDDDHLRNHGFIRDARLPGWRLSPLYDVLPRPSSAYERTLHLGIGPKGRTATIDNALAAADAFGLYGADAREAIAEVWSKVREWKVYFEEHGVSQKEIENIAPAFRHIDDVSSADLRKSLP